MFKRVCRFDWTGIFERIHGKNSKWLTSVFNFFLQAPAIRLPNRGLPATRAAISRRTTTRLKARETAGKRRMSRRTPTSGRAWSFWLNRSSSRRRRVKGWKGTVCMKSWGKLKIFSHLCAGNPLLRRTKTTTDHGMKNTFDEHCAFSEPLFNGNLILLHFFL